MASTTVGTSLDRIPHVVKSNEAGGDDCRGSATNDSDGFTVTPRGGGVTPKMIEDYPFGGLLLSCYIFYSHYTSRGTIFGLLLTIPSLILPVTGALTFAAVTMWPGLGTLTPTERVVIGGLLGLSFTFCGLMQLSVHKLLSPPKRKTLALMEGHSLAMHMRRANEYEEPVENPGAFVYFIFCIGNGPLFVVGSWIFLAFCIWKAWNSYYDIGPLNSIVCVVFGLGFCGAMRCMAGVIVGLRWVVAVKSYVEYWKECLKELPTTATKETILTELSKHCASLAACARDMNYAVGDIFTYCLGAVFSGALWGCALTLIAADDLSFSIGVAMLTASVCNLLLFLFYLSSIGEAYNHSAAGVRSDVRLMKSLSDACPDGETLAIVVRAATEMNVAFRFLTINLDYTKIAGLFGTIALGAAFTLGPTLVLSGM